MYYVDGAVRSAGNDLQNVVADDWRCLIVTGICTFFSKYIVINNFR